MKCGISSLEVFASTVWEMMKEVKDQKKSVERQLINSLGYAGLL